MGAFFGTHLLARGLFCLLGFNFDFTFSFEPQLA